MTQTIFHIRFALAVLPGLFVGLIGNVHAAEPSDKEQLVAKVAAEIKRNYGYVKSVEAQLTVVAIDPGVKTPMVTSQKKDGVTIEITREPRSSISIALSIDGDKQSYIVTKGDDVSYCWIIGDKFTDYIKNGGRVNTATVNAKNRKAMPKYDPRGLGLMDSQTILGLLERGPITKATLTDGVATIESIDQFGFRVVLECDASRGFLPSRIYTIKPDGKYLYLATVEYEQVNAAPQPAWFPKKLTQRFGISGESLEPAAWKDASTITSTVSDARVNEPIDPKVFDIPDFPPGTSVGDLDAGTSHSIPEPAPKTK